MFYKKRLVTPKTKSFAFVFDDFSGGMNAKRCGQISAKYADVCFNTDAGRLNRVLVLISRG